MKELVRDEIGDYFLRNPSRELNNFESPGLNHLKAAASLFLCVCRVRRPCGITSRCVPMFLQFLEPLRAPFRDLLETVSRCYSSFAIRDFSLEEGAEGSVDFVLNCSFRDSSGCLTMISGSKDRNILICGQFLLFNLCKLNFSCLQFSLN